jgi:hypothetical protein
MPRFRVVHTPILKMKHQLRPNNVQKLTKGMASMSAPLSETSTLTMKYDIAIHKKYHIPMTTNCFISSNLILIKSKPILTTLIEFIYAVSKTPSTKQQWYFTVKIIAHKNVYLPHILFFSYGFDNQNSAFTRQVLYLQLHFCNIRCTCFSVCFGVFYFDESIFMEVTSSLTLCSTLSISPHKRQKMRRFAYKGVIYRCFLYSTPLMKSGLLPYQASIRQ